MKSYLSKYNNSATKNIKKKMSNILDLTCIQKYNNILSKTSKKRRYSQADKQNEIINAAAITKFTLTKQVNETEINLINKLFELGKHLHAAYFNVGSDGVVYYIARDKMQNRSYIQSQISTSLKDVHITCDEYDYNSKSYKSTVTSITGTGGSTMKVDYGRYTDTKMHSLVYIYVQTHRFKNDCLFCTNSQNYGIYDVNTQTKVCTKRNEVIEFNFRNGFLSQSSRHPHPVSCIDNDDVMNVLGDALRYTKAVSSEPRRTWKRNAIGTILNTFKKLRWPTHKTFIKSVSDAN